jgi:2-dehydro-3-deoxyphosphooctonate aldolase (KDO 8-P synthase)
MMAEKIAEITAPFERRLVFKCSFDKANRTKASSWRGKGMDEAFRAFDYIRGKLELMVMTDVHEPWQCAEVAHHVDVLQIPAYLCRQTDLLLSAGATGLAVNIKKGQFLSPHEMHWAIDKVKQAGGLPMACERGTMLRLQQFNQRL